jgi:UDP-GlcNAc:undecaprenyl-phosphate GlcNAc-1-phosphate transferase
VLQFSLQDYSKGVGRAARFSLYFDRMKAEGGEEHMLSELVAPVAFIAAIFATYFLRPICLKVGLVDHPDAIRKQHAAPTPLGGGLGILAGILTAALLIPEMREGGLRSFLVALVPLLVAGLWDDLFEARTAVRVIAQIVAGVLMVYEGGVVIRDLGGLVDPVESVVLHSWAAPFTIFCVIGVVNSINMIDGLDGLAGGLVLVALGWFALAASIQGAAVDTVLAVAFMGAVAGFLVFNFRHPFRDRASVFLGDTGSMMLGLVLAWLAVRLTKVESGGMPPMAAVWVIGMPLLDTLSIIVRRVAQGRSPLSPDRDHLHYVLLRAGLSVRQTVSILMLVGLLFGAIGIGAWRFGVPDSVLFYGALSVYAVYLVVMHRVWKRLGTSEGTGIGKN